MVLTQGKGEDQEEDVGGVEGEEVKEASKDTKAKKRMEKEKIVEKPKKLVKKLQQNPTMPNTRSGTRIATVQEK